MSRAQGLQGAGLGRCFGTRDLPRSRHTLNLISGLGMSKGGCETGGGRGALGRGLGDRTGAPHCSLLSSPPSWDIYQLPQSLCHGWVTWGPACGRGCSHVHPAGDWSFRSGNPNIAQCDQVLAKKWSNPYLGQVQGLKFLPACFPAHSMSCAEGLGESRSLLLMV